MRTTPRHGASAGPARSRISRTTACRLPCRPVTARQTSQVPLFRWACPIAELYPTLTLYRGTRRPTEGNAVLSYDMQRTLDDGVMMLDLTIALHSILLLACSPKFSHALVSACIITSMYV